MIDFGEDALARMRQLMKRLGDPQERLQVVHIAGTSGKGSTAYLLGLALQANGKRVGMYTSPHLFDVRERIQIDGEWIPKTRFEEYRARILTLGEPTYFELGTAMAFQYFADENVDYAVIETGMGGLYDATNVVERADKVVVITRIGLDHTDFLGNTIEEITRHKLGIIRPGNPTIIFDPRQHTTPRSESTLLGPHQRENAALALEVLELLARRDGWKIDWTAVENAFRNAHLPGRMDVRQINGQTLVLDGAHNPQKMEALVAALREVFPNRPLHFLIAFKRGKDVEAMQKIISNIATSTINTTFTPQEQDVRNEAADLPNSLPQKEALDEAFRRARLDGGIVVATGSLYFLADLYSHL